VQVGAFPQKATCSSRSVARLFGRVSHAPPRTAVHELCADALPSRTPWIQQHRPAGQLGQQKASRTRETPAQSLSKLGFTGAAFGIRTRDLRITSAPRPTLHRRPRPASWQLQSRERRGTALCPVDPNQLRVVGHPSAPGTFQGLSALSEGLPRDFSPPNAASPRKIGKGLRCRSEALSQAKPQMAADESGCTPDFVTGRPRGRPGDGHPSRADVAAGLVRSTRGLGRAALERPRRALFTALLLTLLQVGFT
jgi:hypothetical protein